MLPILLYNKRRKKFCVLNYKVGRYKNLKSVKNKIESIVNLTNFIKYSNDVLQSVAGIRKQKEFNNGSVNIKIIFTKTIANIVK